MFILAVIHDAPHIELCKGEAFNEFARQGILADLPMGIAFFIRSAVTCIIEFTIRCDVGIMRYARLVIHGKNGTDDLCR